MLWIAWLCLYVWLLWSLWLRPVGRWRSTAIALGAAIIVAPAIAIVHYSFTCREMGCGSIIGTATMYLLFAVPVLGAISLIVSRFRPSTRKASR